MPLQRSPAVFIARDIKLAPPISGNGTDAKASDVRFVAQRTDQMSVVGTKRTYQDVCYLAAFEGKADISQRLSINRDL